MPGAVGYRPCQRCRRSRARWLRDLTVFEGYHEALLVAVEAALGGKLELSDADARSPDVSLRAYLAWCAWRNDYKLGEIRKWLEVFLRRFFQTSQFKRSALPNGPKVGSGGSLSPRGDWRAPSDGNAEAWLADLKRVPAK